MMTMMTPLLVLVLLILLSMNPPCEAASPNSTGDSPHFDSRVLKKYDNLWNCRDIAWSYGIPVKNKALIRCGDPSFAKRGDLDELYRTVGTQFKTVIDLRTKEEIEERSPHANAIRLHVDVTDANGRVYWRPLGDREMLTRNIIASVSLRSFLNFLYYRFVAMKPDRAKYEMMAYMGGLVGFNKLMILNEGDQLADVLKIIATPGHHPIYFGCVAAKDRTALVALLVLLVLDTPLHLINRDYQHSNFFQKEIRTRALQSIMTGTPLKVEKTAGEALKEARDQLAAAETEEEEKVVDDTMEEWIVEMLDEYSRAPSYVMGATLDFIIERFGSVNAYLDQISFDEHWRERMRRTLLSHRETEHPEGIWARIL